MANYKPKACKWCGETFTPNHSRSKYCSQTCKLTVQRATKRKWNNTHKQQLHQTTQQWYKQNKARKDALKKQWASNHPDNVKTHRQNWIANNPDKAGADKARRALAYLNGNATPQLIEQKWLDSDHTCILCGQPIDPTLKAPHPKSRTLEHLTPIARGGRHDLNNLAFAHYGCNASKGSKTLEEWRKQAA